ncbi:MAG: hypothetical protein JW760_02485 [Spirochaetales bacterium]|nr:hypothetical protein [Spirochaetales bacterium]
MKKLLLILTALTLILSGCFLDTSWDGDLSGYQYYDLDVYQSGSKLVVTVTISPEEFNKFKSSIEEGTFSPPEELYLWMSPQFKGNNYERYMYPVARKTLPKNVLFNSDGSIITDGDFIIEVNLAELVNDWSFGWLEASRFDGDNWEPGDDMEGCFFFLSDGYNEYWDWESYTLPGSDEGFYFQNSRPAGTGYSGVREYPDADLSETWIPVSIYGVGLHISSYEVIGKEFFYITLQLEDSHSSFSQLSGWFVDSTGAILDESAIDSERSDVSTDLYVWKVFIGEPADDPGECVFIDESTINKDHNYDLYFDWYRADLFYRGYPVVYMSTDFDGDDYNMDGSFGPAANQIQKSTEYYDWPIYGTPDPIWNNWLIGVPNEEHRYPEADENNNVLGLGFSSVSDFYDPLRNDIVTFPGRNYDNEKNLKVSFKVRSEFDWSYNDYVTVEFEDQYGSYNEIGRLWGGMDWDRQQVDNGWWYYVSDNCYTGTTEELQSVRLRFFSDNNWEESVGIMIDDFTVMELR